MTRARRNPWLPTTLLLCGCGPALKPLPAESLSLYALEAPAEGEAPAARGGPTLLVSMPRAAPGFDGPRMAYLRKAYLVEYFAKCQWVDAPAHMLAPLLVQALERSGRFGAVVRAPSGVDAALRLDTELVRLQQEFTQKPSRVRLTLRVQIVDSSRRAVLASRELEAVEEAPNDDPYGGVVAANRALRRLLGEVAEVCAAASSHLVAPERR
jgi:cholesterol transport system auxiliary component